MPGAQDQGPHKIRGLDCTSVLLITVAKKKIPEKIMEERKVSSILGPKKLSDRLQSPRNTRSTQGLGRRCQSLQASWRGSDIQNRGLGQQTVLALLFSHLLKVNGYTGPKLDYPTNLAKT